MKKFALGKPNRIIAILIVSMLIVSLESCAGTTSSTQTSVASGSVASGSTDETTETTETTSAIDYEALATQIGKDQVRIMLLDPQRPEDMGTVNSLKYKGLDFEAPLTAEVTDEDVDERLSSTLASTLIEPDGDATVINGDTVNIDYEGKLDGEAFDGGSDTDYNLEIGSGSFIDGFEDGLIGMKKGETKDLNLTFPDDYSNTDLAGQDVVFTVTINNISRYIDILDFDDDVAKQLMDDDTATVQSTRESMRQDLELEAMQEAKGDLYNNALAAALDASDVTANDETIEWQLDLTIISYDDSLRNQGLDLATYLGYFAGTDYVSFRSTLYDAASEAARQSVLRYAICDAEGLSYDDDSIETYKDEFQYTDDDISSLSDQELEQAVIWVLAGKAVADSGNVTYVEETTAEETSSADETTAAETTATDSTATSGDNSADETSDADETTIAEGTTSSNETTAVRRTTQAEDTSARKTTTSKETEETTSSTETASY